MEAASQVGKHHPITDPAIKELLKGVAQVGSTASGSDERKSYMLKSSIVRFGCPAIFLAIHERYSSHIGRRKNKSEGIYCESWGFDHQ